ncbi:MAG TPA: N-acetylmuramoyl-L-alanine amidase [Patescibacteria group bacterium]|nr:N-acetylmuramoyl-L-alanine amidase [Patescibacteria group bacterium]
MAACALALIRLAALARPTAVGAAVASSSPPPASAQLAVDGLESGACMSYPAKGRSAATVFIDPGHGGLDPGVVGSAGGKQVSEKQATLAVAIDLENLLRADGYRVVMARTLDSTVTVLSPADSVYGSLTADAAHRDLITRVACANASNAAVLVSIHFDGFDDPTVGGTETFYDAARSFAADNKRLASDLQSALVASLGTYDRGVWSDDQLANPALTSTGNAYGHLIELGPASAGWVDAPSAMPGALVEPLFITDPKEAAIAVDPAGQLTMARAMEAGLLKYLNGA